MSRLLPATAAAIALGLPSAAFATGSTSFITQIGPQTATIDQSGATDGEVGDPTQPLRYLFKSASR